MATAAELLPLAIASHRAGELQKAERIYRQILAADARHAEAWHLLGFLAYQAGKHSVAIDLIARAVEIDPDSANYHNSLGATFSASGRLDEAARCFCRALELSPQYAEAHNNLGNAYRDQGKLEAAIACYRRALELKPDYLDARYNLGNSLRDNRQFAAAVVEYERAVELDPACFMAHNNLGHALAAQGRHADAETSFRRVLELQPNYIEGHNNLGNVLAAQGSLDSAAACYRQALQLDPGFASAHNNLGNVLKRQGHLDAAVAAYRSALEFRADYFHALNNLGNALKEQDSLAAALECYRRALELEPNHVDLHHNQGVALAEQGAFDAAAACYQRALELDPDYADSHFSHSLLRLQAGDFDRGWSEYRWRARTQKRDGVRDFRQPLWEGQPFPDRAILLHAEQGFGDTLQFVRYASLVKSRGGRVLVECQPELHRLLRTVPGIDGVVAGGQRLPEFDLHAPLLSLPGIFGTRLDTIPASVPYLHADPRAVAQWRERLTSSGEFKIGVAWQGNPEQIRDRLRSFPAACLAPLARLPGVRLYSVQQEPTRNRLSEASHALDNAMDIIDLGPQLTDFGETAAVMANLDLVVSCCSAPAHLAGALGVPVFVALAFVPDWRWLLDRDDSPWYPTMRLFRQRERGHWTEVFERIAAALEVALRWRS